MRFDSNREPTAVGPGHGIGRLIRRGGLYSQKLNCGTEPGLAGVP